MQTLKQINIPVCITEIVGRGTHWNRVTRCSDTCDFLQITHGIISCTTYILPTHTQCDTGYNRYKAIRYQQCRWRRWCTNYKFTFALLCSAPAIASRTCVLGMTLSCIHIFIVTGSFLYWCVMRSASQRFFIHDCIYLRIVIISYLATCLGTKSLSVLMCRKAVNQSISHERTLMHSARDTIGCNNQLLYAHRRLGSTAALSYKNQHVAREFRTIINLY